MPKYLILFGLSAIGMSAAFSNDSSAQATSADAAGSSTTQAIPVGSSRLLIGERLQPIVDTHLIDRMRGTSLRLHSPCPREVVFTFDAPWEGSQSGYITIMRDDDVVRMYYRGGGDLGREYTCMAVSKDGIHWERPKLGLIEFRGSTAVDGGSKDNNIIWTGRRKAYFGSHDFAAFKDTNPAARPQERYKAVTLSKLDIAGRTRRVLVALISTDGVHWKHMQEEPIITEGSFDSQNVAFWDSPQNQYVCYLRESQQGKRSVARSTSKDFLHWSKPELLDFGGTPIEQLYTNGVVPYFRAPHVYLGFPMRFISPSERKTVGFEPRETDGLSDAVFMSSYDGLHWNRPFMEAFIRPGLDPKNWGGAHGNSTPAWGILQTGPDEVSVYWSEHYDNYPKRDITPQLRRGTLRLDGFVSVNAPYNGGEFTTWPLIFEGKRLLLNCSTSAPGSIKVELQDATGRVIPGKSLDDCVEIWGDEIERRVGWKGGGDLGALAGRPIRLRFVMKDADLYAFRFAP